ncbi:MAG: hypothetical protein K9H64_10795 [Bacteroidales bacterium]|nr:hypothetical protein [Bacteroidales bacterium]MCF8456414.1 hypothetical protein [Bacteroidales bacterium]
MRLNSKDILFGQPVLKIREVIRSAMQEKLWGTNENEICKKISVILKTNPEQAKKVVEQLIDGSYLKLMRHSSRGETQFELTVGSKGSQFGLASAASVITRQKANQLLSDLIERAKVINARDDLVYYVDCLRVFGSFLSDKDTLGDLDIGYKLISKYKGREFTLYNQARIKIAENTGRHFNNFVEKLAWPRDEIVKALKAKKRGLSLHDIEIDDVFSKTVSKIVFQRDEKN